MIIISNEGLKKDKYDNVIYLHNPTAAFRVDGKAVPGELFHGQGFCYYTAEMPDDADEDDEWWSYDMAHAIIDDMSNHPEKYDLTDEQISKGGFIYSVHGEELEVLFEYENRILTKNPEKGGPTNQ